MKETLQPISLKKYFAEKAVVEVTPVLKYNGGEALGTPVSYQGTKVQGNDETIQYKAGGTVTQGFSLFIFRKWQSQFYLCVLKQL